MAILPFITSDRQKINLFSLLVTLGVLFVAVTVSDGSFAANINKISKNLDKALSEIIEGKRPNFTELSDNATYVSSQVFNPRGMAGLYNLTKAFMNLILAQDSTYLSGFLKVENNSIVSTDLQAEWKDLLIKFGGLLALIIICLLFIVLVPVSGCFFCCCRCCGKCGARSQPFDKKHDLCMKICLGTLLIALGTLLLFGVVCAFVSTQQMNEGVNELTKNLNGNVKDVNTYLDTTKGQVETLLNVNYDEFQAVLVETIKGSSDVVFDKLAEYSNAVSLTELANLVRTLPSVRDDFQTLKYSTRALRIWAPQLNDAVRKIKKDLIATLNSPACDALIACKAISQNVSALDTNIHFNNLPDMTGNIGQLEALLEDADEYETAVKEGENKLQDIKFKIGEAVNTTMKQAQEKIEEAGTEIQKGSKDVVALIEDLKLKVNSNTKPALDTTDDIITRYYPYVYYVGLGLSCLLLIIAICIIFGLICGICGKRPDGYGDDCCNKGSGSSFLICGVMFIFIASLVFGVLVLVASVLGIVTQRIVCDTLRYPNDSEVFKLVNQLNLTEYYINFDVSEVLDSIHQNKSIYEVFNLKSQFDLDEVSKYLETFKIEEILDNLNISGQIPSDFTLLTPESKALIRKLGDSEFDNLSWDEFTDQLNSSFTTANFTLISNELDNVISQLNNQTQLPGVDQIVRDLTLSKITIDAYQSKLVEPMMHNATSVVVLVKKIQSDLHGNKTSFKEEVDTILVEIEEAEHTLGQEGSVVLAGVARNFTEGVINQVKTYLDRIVTKTRDDVGRCGPLSLVLNSVLTSTCDKIVLPMNGFWFGLFWCLILFIPILFVSVKLATLYQKYGPYSGPLVEAEYLCDAYAERDTIPLSSRNSKVKKKGKKYKRYEDRPLPPAGADRVATDYTAASHHPDQRYADMAPKHWEEFPAGGPPQYQRAPTEYERPPPYYYPGAAESQQ